MLPAFVTNLLWGNPEENDALEKQSVVEHSVREAGDDWLLVDTAQRTTGNQDNIICIESNTKAYYSIICTLLASDYKFMA